MRPTCNTPASAVRWIPLAERALIARGRFDRLDHGHVLPHDPRHHRVKVLADERAVEGDVVRKPAEDGYGARPLAASIHPRADSTGRLLEER